MNHQSTACKKRKKQRQDPGYFKDRIDIRLGLLCQRGVRLLFFKSMLEVSRLQLAEDVMKEVYTCFHQQTNSGYVTLTGSIMKSRPSRFVAF